MGSIHSFATRFVLVAGTVGSLLVAGAAPAAAYTPSAAGSPGTVATPVIWGGHVSGYLYADGRMYFPDRVVTESARYAAYDQYVCVKANVVYAMWNATSWAPNASQSQCAWIPASGTAVTIPGVVFDVLTHGIFIYSGNVEVTWQLRNGALIGKQTLDYNQVGDYACYNSPCAVGSSTTLGAYLDMTP